MIRSDLVRPASWISPSAFCQMSFAFPSMSLLLKLEHHLGVRLDLLLEARGVEPLELADGPLPVIEDHVVDEVVDVGITRLEQVLGDVPRLPDAPADHGVQGDPVDDDAIEVLDDGVAALEAEQDHITAAPHA